MLSLYKKKKKKKKLVEILGKKKSIAVIKVGEINQKSVFLLI